MIKHGLSIAGLCLGLLMPLSVVQAIELLGVCTHFALKRNEVDKALPLVKELGFNSVRDDIFWDHLEGRPGKFSMPPHIRRYVDGVHKAGLGLVLPLGYGNRMLGISKPVTAIERDAYVRYVSYVVTELKGRGVVYELWNEWDLKTGGVREGQIDDYLKLMKDVVPVIKRIDPGAKIIVGGFSSRAPLEDWLEQVVKSSVFSQVDGISFHPYVHYKRVGRESSAEAMYEMVTRVEHRVRQARGGKPVDIYLTELGWTSFGRIPQAFVADQVAKSIMLLSSLPYVKGLWLYDLQNDGHRRGEPEDNFGLVDHEGRPKDAFLSVKDAVEILRATGPVKLIQGPFGYLWAGKKKSGGGATVVYWSDNATRVSIAGQELGPERRTVRAMGRQSGGVFQAAGNAGRRRGGLAMSAKPEVLELDTSSFEVLDASGEIIARIAL